MLARSVEPLDDPGHRGVAICGPGPAAPDLDYRIDPGSPAVSVLDRTLFDRHNDRTTGRHGARGTGGRRAGDLKVGQKVFAIGNPFGLDYKLTSGLVSALDRSLAEDNGVTIAHLIQTDAAINPGNSGGPLLDSAGRLIGINTAIYSPSSAYAGIGFAVPVDTVNRVVPQLIAGGKYIRPSLGVGIDADINRALTKQLGVEGVLLLKVEPGSAADAAGLRGTRIDQEGDIVPGDIIAVASQPASRWTLSPHCWHGSMIIVSGIALPCVSGEPDANWMSMSFCKEGTDRAR